MDPLMIIATPNICWLKRMSSTHARRRRLPRRRCAARRMAHNFAHARPKGAG